MINKTNFKEKTSNGITLIALVITIIVLLILAGISIATLTGKNGVLTKANEAKVKTEIEEAKEQAKLDIADWIADKMEKGEDTYLDDEIVKTILTGKGYVKELQEDSFISDKGHSILYSDLYTTREKERISFRFKHSKYNGFWETITETFFVDDGTTWEDVLTGAYPNFECFSEDCYWRVEDQVVLVGGIDGFRSTSVGDMHGADFDVLIDEDGNPVSRHSKIKSRFL